MRRANAGFGRRPGDVRVLVARIAQRRGGDQQPLRRRGQRRGERYRRVEPVAMQANIDIPRRVPPVKAQEHHVAGPLTRFGLRLRQALQHPLPGLQWIERAPQQRAADRLDPVAGGFVHVLGFLVQAGEQADAQSLQRFSNANQRSAKGFGGLGESIVDRKDVAFQSADPTATFRASGAGKHLMPDQPQEGLGRIAPNRFGTV